MADIKFEGEIDGISERQLEFVSSVLEELGYNNEKVVISAVGNAEDNFVSVVKRFVVEKDGEIFTMVVKLASTSELHRANAPPEIVFRNEHIMYTEVFPKFSELEEEAGVPNNERLKYPKCYGSLCEAPNEILLLEDLQPSHFGMLDKHKPLPDETIKLILKNFARLHSLSFVLNYKEPEIYESIKSKLVNFWTMITKSDEFKGLINNLEDDMISILDNDKHKNILQGLLTKISEHAAENRDIDKDSRYAAIQHGDSWCNNILFRLEGDKPVECCMLDYQVANHISPVADVEFMIFVSTDYETRSKHYHEWIEYYHTELDKCLANFSLSADYIYPRHQLDSDLKRFGKFCLGLSIFFSSMVMRESGEAANMKAAMQDEKNDMDEVLNASKISNMSELSKNRFKDKLEGLITSYIELGYY